MATEKLLSPGSRRRPGYGAAAVSRGASDDEESRRNVENSRSPSYASHTEDGPEKKGQRNSNSQQRDRDRRKDSRRSPSTDGEHQRERRHGSRRHLEGDGDREERDGERDGDRDGVAAGSATDIYESFSDGGGDPNSRARQEEGGQRADGEKGIKGQFTRKSRRTWKTRKFPGEKRRFERKKATEDMYDDEQRVSWRLSAYCTCKEYNFSKLVEFIEKQNEAGTGVFGSAAELALYPDVVEVDIVKSRRQQSLFLFAYGCSAFFNFTQREEQQILSTLRQFEFEPVSGFLEQTEEMEYMYGDVFRVAHDLVTLSTDTPLEKLSVAYALAQCAKLNVFEERVSDVIEENKYLPEHLGKTGTIGLSRKSISMKIGQLFVERNDVNLHFDILDTPEFFWEQDQYKPVYDKLCEYLELSKRVDVLNQRLGVMHELFDVLNQQLENMHAHQLEWVIIWLICLEVFISIVWNIILKDILGWFPQSGS